MKISKYLPYIGFVIGLLMSCVAVGSLHSKHAAQPVKKNEALKIAGRKAPVVKDSSSPASDAYIRNRVVKLYHPERGQCTGVVVQGASGRNWVLTAAHCKVLIQDGRVLAEEQDGRISQMYLVAESPTSDLLLLSQDFPSYSGVKIAKELKMYDKVHSITRGAGMPAYRTDGEALGMREVMFAVGDIILLPEEEAACLITPKFKIMPGIFGEKYCVMAMNEQVVTAKIVPGSSGGPLFNAKGELVGIASASDTSEHFFYFVKLTDIIELMKGR